MAAPNQIAVFIPALGILMPFVVRWLENRSRLKQAKHLIEVIQTREEIDRLLRSYENDRLQLKGHEKRQLELLKGELDKEIKQQDKSRYSIFVWLVSLELIFFISAIFSHTIDFFERLVFEPGHKGFPFLEGIFSNAWIRLCLLLFFLLMSFWFSYSYRTQESLRHKKNFVLDLWAFLLFNAVFASLLAVFGLLLFWLDWLSPWF